MSDDRKLREFDLQIAISCTVLYYTVPKMTLK